MVKIKMVNKMEIAQRKLNLEDKLILYIDNKLIDKNMEDTVLATDKLELIIRYLKS